MILWNVKMYTLLLWQLKKLFWNYSNQTLVKFLMFFWHVCTGMQGLFMRILSKTLRLEDLLPITVIFILQSFPCFCVGFILLLIFFLNADITKITVENNSNLVAPICVCDSSNTLLAVTGRETTNGKL